MIEWEIDRMIEEKERELLDAIKKKQWVLAQKIADEIRQLKLIRKKLSVPDRIPRPKPDPFIRPIMRI